MRFTHLFLIEAQEEYEVALQWYLQRSSKAAENFVIAFENTLALVCENPKGWRNQFANYFEIKIKRYPFSIVYLIDTKNHLILITSVFYHSRNPIGKYRI